ncbi:mucin-5AC-like [Saccostrea echinata]|uniref:mucin-5AC-like n=1 Tax=Saccostrea echinata TaxID=191078 RepID=UPI002A80F26B|nr:mucin-5AC-like [Saccostrea echinata]
MGPGQSSVVPPADVVQLFELLLKPSVQDYMQAVVKQFKSGQSESCVNSQMVDKSYETLDQEIRMPTLTTQTWTPYTNYTQPPPWSAHDTYISEQTPQTTLNTPTLKTPTKQSTTRNTHFQHFTTLQDNNVISTPQSFITTHNIQPRYTHIQSLQNTNTDPLSITNVLPFQNAVTQSVQDTNTLSFQNTVTQSVQNMTLSPQSTTSPVISQQNTLPTTPRRSPRKHASTPEDSDSQMTKLLAHHSLKVRRESLRKAKDAAKKAHPTKMAFTMTAKLLPAIFSWEELASSRGQGIKSKEGDLRPVLDNSKMDVLKEYIAIWCNQNGGSFSEKSVNDAVTEQVSYARKKIKSKATKN